jgi:CheY-like chemotaxis protein
MTELYQLFSLAPYYIDQIKRAVHVLISSAANIGAEKRSVFCKQLEALGRGNQFIWQLDCFLRYAGSGSSINFPAKSIKGNLMSTTLPPKRILVAGNEPETLVLMRVALKKYGFEVSAVADGEQALQQFRSNPCDMVILYVDIPRLNGFQVLTALRKKARCDLPFILVIGMDDTLTELPNYRSFLDRLDREIRRAKMQGGKLAVLSTGLGRFTIINDSMGYPTGDNLLQLAADRLRENGIHIALDDFGTGYSSMSYLNHIPLNTLKIDQSFVKELPHDKENFAIFIAIISMAKSLGYAVVAEVVETIEQVQILDHLNCDVLQGYFFSKPVDTSEIITLSRKQWEIK